MEAIEGVRRIETVGAIVRGPYGQLSRIVGVYEHTRCGPGHVSKPLDVVVRLEPVGPSYGHNGAWASDLQPAKEGDRGAHPHTAPCACGEPYGNRGGYWYHVPSSWSV